MAIAKNALMTANPHRRWFQLRLNTWLVLVAILGWAMATQPYMVISNTVRTFNASHEASSATFRLDKNKRVAGANARWPEPWWTEPFVVGGFHNQDGGTGVSSLALQHPNPRLLAPAFALLAFLVWRSASRAVERGRERPSPPAKE